MPRRSRTDQELGWLRNAWEEMAAVEIKHGVVMKVTIRPSGMRSRFYVHLEAERPDTPGGFGPYKAKVSTSYPNGDATSFLPWLWNTCARFGEYIENDDVLVAPREK